MRDSLQNKCDKFIRIRDDIKKAARWGDNMIVPVCANIYVEADKEFDREKFLQCKELLEQETGFFSKFRGNSRLPVICMLSISDNPKQKLADTLAIYEELKNSFFQTEYLALVATILSDMISVDEAPVYAQRGRRLYDCMKEEHPFLTAAEDSVFAVLLAFSDKEDKVMIEEMELIYDEMKKSYSNSNAVQSLSHILSLTEGNYREKCDRVNQIFFYLSMMGKKYGKYHELSVLGACAILDVSIENMVADMMDAESFLAKQKGYGVFGLDKKTRLMHAAMIAIDEYSAKAKALGSGTTAAVTGTLALVAAQQAVMCAVIASCATTANAN